MGIKPIGQSDFRRLMNVQGVKHDRRVLEKAGVSRERLDEILEAIESPLQENGWLWGLPNTLDRFISVIHHSYEALPELLSIHESVPFRSFVGRNVPALLVAQSKRDESTKKAMSMSEEQDAFFVPREDYVEQAITIQSGKGWIKRPDLSQYSIRLTVIPKVFVLPYREMNYELSAYMFTEWQGESPRIKSVRLTLYPLGENTEEAFPNEHLEIRFNGVPIDFQKVELHKDHPSDADKYKYETTLCFTGTDSAYLSVAVYSGAVGTEMTPNTLFHSSSYPVANATTASVASASMFIHPISWAKTLI